MSRRRTVFKWLLALGTLALAIVGAEALLRVSLFHSSVGLASQDPEYYARNLDELWIYRQLFSGSKRWTVGSRGQDASGETRIEFYRKWGTSLKPDAELGYVRAPDVRTPCHETTSLGTRGTHEYTPDSPKIVFLGDSFVESAACSADTLTAKVEKLTGIDTLNYGVGGYGLDQIFIYFKRILPAYAGKDPLFLIGLIQDDLGRVLLGVRTSPKPYFTLRDGELVLHTEHIDPKALDKTYEHLPERFYLYYFLRGKLGYPIYRSLLNETRAQRQNAIYALSERIVRQIAEIKRSGQFSVAFVIFPTPGNPFDPNVLSMMRAAGLPVVDLQGCLHGRPDTELYAELHPTSLGNDMLAQCLIRELSTMGLLSQSSGKR